MSRPKPLTSALVPIVVARLPDELSAMFASSRIATMLASFSGAGAGAGGGAADAVAFAALSAAAAESAALSFFEHAAQRAHMPKPAMMRVRRVVIRSSVQVDTPEMSGVAGPARANSIRVLCGCVG